MDFVRTHLRGRTACCESGGISGSLPQVLLLITGIMPQGGASLRIVAKRLGLSIATVSEALNDGPRVAPKTRARILAEANRLAYVRNPLVSSVMSFVRQRRQERLHGTIAVLDYTDDEAVLIPFHQAVYQGADARAQSLGFKLELFWIGPSQLKLPRVDQILTARNTQGVLVLPFRTARDWSELSWGNYSSASMDYCLSRPLLHGVLPDHHLGLLNTLRRLLDRGYRRPGLFVNDFQDRRLKYRYTSTYLGFAHQHVPNPQIPPLAADAPTQGQFLEWYFKHRPDVIVSHEQVVIAWLKDAGIGVPREVGFVHLNHLNRSGPCAGIDLKPTELGAAAIELVVAQIHRNERGVPPTPRTTTIEGVWVEGPTVLPEVRKPRSRRGLTSRPPRPAP